MDKAVRVVNEFGYATPIFREKLLKDLHGVTDRKHAEAYESLDQDLLAVAVESLASAMAGVQADGRWHETSYRSPSELVRGLGPGRALPKGRPNEPRAGNDANCRNLRRHLPTAMEVLPNQLAAHRQLIGASCFTGTCLKFKQIARGGGENERPLAGHLRACSWGRGGGGGSTQNDPHDKVSDFQLTSDMWRGKFVEWLL